MPDPAKPWVLLRRGRDLPKMDFATLEDAQRFYDRGRLHNGPALGATIFGPREIPLNAWECTPGREGTWAPFERKLLGEDEQAASEDVEG